jgi:hypothetical protein
MQDKMERACLLIVAHRLAFGEAPQGFFTRWFVMGEEKNSIFSSPITNHRVKKGLPAQKKWGMTQERFFMPKDNGRS